MLLVLKRMKLSGAHVMRDDNVLIGMLQPAVNPARLPLLLLLFALSTVFLFGNDRGHFYREGHHNYLSSDHLAIAVNLSPAHNFLMFHRQTLDADGDRSYAVYNRFPVGGYALIKLATLPAGNDLSAKIYAARMLMLLCFSITVVLAYLSLCRLTSNRWISLTATLLAFSSFYCLYYNDMISNEVAIDLFAVMLTFHGMIIFMQDSRFPQLLIKTCVALLLGWHVFALLLPFVVFGLVSRRRAGEGERLVSSRFLILGVAAFLFGTLILTFNFANEYIALKGEVPVSQLPSVQSALGRAGLDGGAYVGGGDGSLDWPIFLKGQFSRIFGMTVPFSVAFSPSWLGAVLGAGVFSVCLRGLWFVRHQIPMRILMGTLVLSGWCWALPMRENTAVHEFESVFYIGIPLAFFSLVLLYLHDRHILSDSRLGHIAVAAWLVFMLSSFHIGFRGIQVSGFHRAAIALLPDHLSERIVKGKLPRFQFHEASIADFEAIRTKVGSGKIVAVSIERRFEAFDAARSAVDYYLAGSIIEYREKEERCARADFVVTSEREESPALLTPDNRRLFLYDATVCDDESRGHDVSS